MSSSVRALVDRFCRLCCSWFLCLSHLGKLCLVSSSPPGKQAVNSEKLLKRWWLVVARFILFLQRFCSQVSRLEERVSVSSFLARGSAETAKWEILFGFLLFFPDLEKGNQYSIVKTWNEITVVWFLAAKTQSISFRRIQVVKLPAQRTQWRTDKQLAFFLFPPFVSDVLDHILPCRLVWALKTT